eukprot:scaffold17406_cov116-Isochrysis_galbana.AAC.6
MPRPTRAVGAPSIVVIGVKSALHRSTPSGRRGAKGERLRIGSGSHGRRSRSARAASAGPDSGNQNKSLFYFGRPVRAAGGTIKWARKAWRSGWGGGWGVGEGAAGDDMVTDPGPGTGRPGGHETRDQGQDATPVKLAAESTGTAGRPHRRSGDGQVQHPAEAWAGYVRLCVLVRAEGHGPAVRHEADAPSKPLGEGAPQCPTRGTTA